MSRDFAQDCDAADILAPYRKQFELPLHASGQPLIYLCGHSLGLAPRAALDYVSEELADWAQLGVAGHHTATRPWIDYAQNFTKGLQHVTGAQANEVVAMNSLTVNLHLMMASFYRPVGMRDKVLIEAGAFSSDRHAILGQLSWHKLDPEETLIELAPRAGEETLRIEDIEAKIDELGSELALVLWPGVQYRTGQAFDCARITRAAHAQGAIAGFDMAHAIGNLPLRLHDWDVDFAVWCSYKYLNAGPGAIGGCFVHERHFGNAPSRLVRLVGPRAADALPDGAGVSARHRRRRLGREQPAYLLGRAAASPRSTCSAPPASTNCAPSPCGSPPTPSGCCASASAATCRSSRPRLPKSAAASFSLRVNGGPRRGRRIFDALGDHGIVCDWREPDIIRIAPAPLYNRFIDIFEFVDELAAALKEIA